MMEWKITQVIVDAGSMTAAQLLAAVDQGDRVEKPAVDGVVRAAVMRVRADRSGLDADLFVLFGCGQVHCLNRASTDAARLFAHWRGFNP